MPHKKTDIGGDFRLLAHDAQNFAMQAHGHGEHWSKGKVYPHKYYSKLEKRQGPLAANQLTAFNELFEHYLRVFDDQKYASKVSTLAVNEKILNGIKTRNHITH
jgi:hypothetical protein